MACSCSQKCECKSFKALSKLLANSYVLFLKTQNVHWNVVGSDFRGIHLMTEEHYNDLFAAIDVIAERIRMIGAKSPATFAEFLDLASIDDSLPASTGTEMLKALLAAHEAVRDDIKAGLAELADSNDNGTVDILAGRLGFHEKTIWMLKASVE